MDSQFEENKIYNETNKKDGLSKLMDNYSESNDFTDLEEFQFVPL